MSVLKFEFDGGDNYEVIKMNSLELLNKINNKFSDIKPSIFNLLIRGDHEYYQFCSHFFDYYLIFEKTCNGYVISAFKKTGLQDNPMGERLRHAGRFIELIK